MLGLDKLFYIRFQVILLAALIMLYHGEHGAGAEEVCLVVGDEVEVWLVL